MSMGTDDLTPTNQEPGFKVTVKDVWLEVRDIKSLLDGRLRKLESQVAAQWVVIGIIVVALGALAGRAMTLTFN